MLLKKAPVAAVICAVVLSAVFASLPADPPDAHAETKTSAEVVETDTEGGPTAPIQVAHADPAAPAPLPRSDSGIEIREETVGRGDTLAEILARAGLSPTESHHVSRALGKAYNLRRIRPGQTLRLALAPDDGSDGWRLRDLVLRVDARSEVHVARRDGAREFDADKVVRTLTRDLARSEGTIRDSLYVAATRADLPAPVIAEMIRIFSWDVDFQRDIQRGDSFELVYEVLRDDDGKAVDTGNVRVAVMTLSGDRREFYRHELADGRVDYFDSQGRGARKALMRTPINGARLSSGYGRRKHPILGYSKMHRGVDFAAPAGTPILAAGDGVVVKRQRKGGYGKYIRLRHNSEFGTAYAHLKSYAKGIQVGKRVRQGQIIGYVGSTGRSTGPHLHFEIHKNGRQVNPMRVRMPSGEKLKGKELVRFETARAAHQATWKRLAEPGQMARAE